MTLWQHLVSEGTVLVWWAADAIVHQICKDFTRFTRDQLIISRSALIHNVFNRITLIITRYQLNVNDYHKVWDKMRNGGMFVEQLSCDCHSNDFKCKCLGQHGIVIMTCCPHILLSYKGGTIWANIYHRCLFFLTECKYFSLIYVIKRRPSSYRRRVEKLVSEGASSCFLTLISLKVPPTLLLMGMAHHKVRSLTFALPFPGLKGED